MRILIFAIAVLTLTACSSKPSARKSEEPILPVKLPPKMVPKNVTVNVTVKKCMNIQEGDRHVEFDGSSLWLAEGGRPQELKLEGGAQVTCEKFEVLKDRRHAVLIEYATTGSTSVAKRAIADIKTATWITKPTPLHSHGR